MKRILSVLMILCLVLPMATEFVGCSGGGVTRSEWIGMLSEQFGLDDYVTESAVFTDVKQGSDCFTAVQSCADWNIIDREDSSFRPNDPADVRFAVMTAARAAGSNVSEDEAMALATNDNIVKGSSYSETKGRLSKEKAAEILDWAKEMYLSTSSEDYQNVVLNPNLIDITDAAGIVEVSEDVYITNRAEDKNISIGDIVILPGTEKDPDGVAKKIIGIETQPNGSIKWTTVTPEIGEVCSDLEFASTVVPSAEDIILEDGVTMTSSKNSGVSATGGAKYANLGGSSGDSSGSDDVQGLSGTFEINFIKGTVSVSPRWNSLFGMGEDVSIGVDQAYNLKSFLNEKAGVWLEQEDPCIIPDRTLWGKNPYDHMEDISAYRSGKISLDELKNKMKLDKNGMETEVAHMEAKYEGTYEITGSFSIENFYIKPELKLKKKFGIPVGIERLTVSVNYGTSVKITAKGELEASLKVCTIPCPIAGGLSVDIELYLTFDANGEASLSASTSNYTKINYEGGQTKKVSENDTDFSFQASAQIDVGPKVSLTLRLLGIGIIDVSVDVLGRLKADLKLSYAREIAETDESLVVHDITTFSFSLNAYCPIVELSIGSVKGTLASKIGLSFNWTIIGENKAHKWEVIPEKQIPLWEVVQTIKKCDDEVNEEQPSDISFEFLTLESYFLYVEKGSTGTITIKEMPEGYTESDLIWESADPSIAQVSGGNVRGIESGNTTITVKTKDGMYQAICSVLVPSEAGEFTPINPT